MSASQQSNNSGATSGILTDAESTADVPTTSPGYEAAVLVLVTLSTITVILRLISRRVARLQFWWDDILIIIAMCAAWALAGAFIWGASKVMGASLVDIVLHDTVIIGKAGFMSEIAYVCTLPFIKVSILLWYRRIFPNAQLLSMTWFLSILSVAWGVAFVLTLILGCSPVRIYWDPIPGHLCQSGRGNSVLIANAISNILIDIMIMILPMPVIWRLKMQGKKKWGVRAIFLLGTFVIIASGVRTRYLVSKQANIFSSSLWSNIEPNVAIICACLPSLMPLLRAMSRRGQGTRSAPASGDYRMTPSKRIWSPATLSPNSDIERFSKDEHTGTLLVQAKDCGSG